jgi:hypothetical protein
MVWARELEQKERGEAGKAEMVEDWMSKERKDRLFAS